MDIELIVSDEGYGANAHIKTNKPLVVVTGPGPGSGKLATCLSQCYHEYKRGIKAGYAKFETFPVWDLAIKHPVNVAYEAATADIRDFNLIDPFHIEAYKETAVNYNRDVEAFPLMERILEKISTKASPYKSPTDMGVNRVSSGIVDDAAVQEAAGQEVIRRFFRYRCEYAMGFVDKDTVQRVEMLMEGLGLGPSDRAVVEPALKALEESQKKNKSADGLYCGAAIELRDGTIITGKNSKLLHSTAGLVLNAVKHLSGIPDKIHLLSPAIIESISLLKKNITGKKRLSLDLDETLIALSISATTNPTAQLAMERLKELQGCEVHLTHIPLPGDEAGLRRLGVNLTSEPDFAGESLYPF